MALVSPTHSQFSEDMTWNSLVQVIATTSGFQRWCAERAITGIQSEDLTQEQLVKRYLRETLETLAY